MWNEAEALPINDRAVSAQGLPEVPVHAFVSSRNEDPQWKQAVTAYAEATGGQALLLDGDHYIHLDYPELIAEESRTLIEGASGE